LVIGREGHAVALVDQPPDPAIAPGSSSPLDYLGQMPGAITADDVLLASPAIANLVTWWGQHAPRTSGIDDYLVAFYADAAGHPGAKLAEFDVAFASSPHASIPNLMECRAVSQSPQGLITGCRSNNASPATAWRWNNSVYGSDVSVKSNAPPGTNRSRF
jgi:hypothetical protein